ncbi:alpha/beta hydrolase family protein [Alloiococcus sp. CFN-8]|uniref:alpha/beta hydrolase family protein n=1 Tax=Alloiococcus sp. CFN-8 TaxID=3416081 RepID=UPI003CFB7C12
MLVNDNLIIDKVYIEGIPALVFKPRNTLQEGLPLVILYHGWSSNKENQVMLASTIALYGYVVLAADAVNHGERGSLDYSNEKNVVEKFWPTIFNNINESSKLIDYGINVLKADKERLAVMGHSMGGFTASGVFVSHPDFKTVINISGSFAYEKAEELMMSRFPGVYVDEEHKRELREYDPVLKLDMLNNRPILMLHGGDDQVIPRGGQEYFYKEAKSLYKNKPSDFKLVIYEGGNHSITIKMIEELIIWLQEKL